MSKMPAIGRFVDDEEKTLIEAIERDNYRPGKDHLTEERAEELQTAARATINEERTRTSISVCRNPIYRA